MPLPASVATFEGCWSRQVVRPHCLIARGAPWRACTSVVPVDRPVTVPKRGHRAEHTSYPSEQAARQGVPATPPEYGRPGTDALVRRALVRTRRHRLQPRPTRSSRSPCAWPLECRIRCGGRRRRGSARGSGVRQGRVDGMWPAPNRLRPHHAAPAEPASRHAWRSRSPNSAANTTTTAPPR